MGGFISLTRSGAGLSYSIARSSAEGRTDSYATTSGDRQPDPHERRLGRALDHAHVPGRFAGTGQGNQVSDGADGRIIAPVGTPSRAADVSNPYQLALAGEGSLLISDLANNVIRRADAAFPRAQTAAMAPLPQAQSARVTPRAAR